MARIRPIAVLTKDTEKLAAFYKTSFGPARSREAVNRPRTAARSIFLTATSIWRFFRRETAAREFFTLAWKCKT